MHGTAQQSSQVPRRPGLVPVPEFRLAFRYPDWVVVPPRYRGRRC